MANLPKANIKPGPLVRRADGFQAEQIADGTLQTKRRWMVGRNARIGSVVHRVADDGDFAGALVQQRHVHIGHLAPQAEQRAAPRSQTIDGLPPAVSTDDGARPWSVHRDGLDMRDAVEQGHGYPKSFATFWKP